MTQSDLCLLFVICPSGSNVSNVVSCPWGMGAVWKERNEETQECLGVRDDLACCLSGRRRGGPGSLPDHWSQGESVRGVPSPRRVGTWCPREWGAPACN